MSSKIAFQKGWRASKDKFRIYNISEGPSLSTGIDPETWDLLKFQEREHISATWKERHAKGVPVKITSEEGHKKWYALDPERNWQEGDHVVRKGNPVVEIGWPVIATFCNFRYKPEWLEKKGGQHAGV